jgi:hypothetical protein
MSVVLFDNINLKIYQIIIKIENPYQKIIFFPNKFENGNCNHLLCVDTCLYNYWTCSELEDNKIINTKKYLIINEYDEQYLHEEINIQFNKVKYLLRRDLKQNVIYKNKNNYVICYTHCFLQHNIKYYNMKKELYYNKQQRLNRDNEIKQAIIKYELFLDELTVIINKYKNKLKLKIKLFKNFTNIMNLNVIKILFDPWFIKFVDTNEQFIIIDKPNYYILTDKTKYNIYKSINFQNIYINQGFFMKKHFAIHIYRYS